MREPAPPYAGEGPHALLHVSENPAIARFDPHVSVRVVSSTREFSGIRLRNAEPRPAAGTV